MGLRNAPFTSKRAPNLARAAICAALVAVTPLPAAARWTHHYRGYHERVRVRHPRDYWSACIGDPVGRRDPQGRLVRCEAARDEFQRENPCPSTGLPRGPCPGYVVDHIVPLKRGGADDPSNMQWQTVEDARAKDKIE